MTDNSEDTLPPSPAPLPYQARRAIVYLMRHGAILASGKQVLFDHITRHEDAIRQHFAETYLKLVVDHHHGLAFIASYDESYFTELREETGDSTIKSLTPITRQRMSLDETLMVLVLRKHYRERENAGEQVITIDEERLRLLLVPFLPISDNKSLDKQKLSGRIRKMKDINILKTIRGSEDRYQITPLIRYVGNAATLEAMLKEYERIAEEHGASSKASPSAPTSN